MARNTILVATDGSPSADRAVAFAATLCHTLGATLVILCVQETPEPSAVRAFESIEHVAGADLGEFTAHAVLDRARLHAQKAGVRDVKTRAESGDPTQRILDVAKTEDAQIVIAGKRGRGPLAALLLGSVSQKLASLCPCPVVVVP